MIRIFSFGILTGQCMETMRRFCPSGVSLFVGGIEVWYYAQIHWFSCSFRWQAFGVLLLIYWILGALWRTRDEVLTR